MKWGAGEGCIRTVTRLLQKLIGGIAKSAEGVLLTTLLNGLVQIVVGFIGSRKRDQEIFTESKLIVGGVLIGVISTGMMFLSLLAFTYEGADIGIVTFMVSLSILPGALLDWIFFKTHLVPRQFLGLCVYALAGYSVLNFPDLKAFLGLPAWVIISFGIALLFAINEAITRKIRKMDPLVNNFWTGTTQVAIVGIALLIIWSISGLEIIHQLPVKFWPLSILIGLTTVGVLASRLMSYKGGGTIARRKVVMQGTYLSTAMIAGVLAYGEPLTVGKVIGILGFLLALTLIDQETWETVCKRLKGRFVQ